MIRIYSEIIYFVHLIRRTLVRVRSFQRLYRALQHLSVQHHLHFDFVHDLQEPDLSDRRVRALKWSKLPSSKRFKAAFAVVSDRACPSGEYLCLHLLAVERRDRKFQFVQVWNVSYVFVRIFPEAWLPLQAWCDNSFLLLSNLFLFWTCFRHFFTAIVMICFNFSFVFFLFLLRLCILGRSPSASGSWLRNSLGLFLLRLVHAVHGLLLFLFV